MRHTQPSAAAFEQFQPVVTKRASEAIYEQVKELIVSGALKPGDRLPSERNMLDMFQRSRPTIREALRMLERSGYIRTVPGSNGAIVQEPSNANVQQTMEDAMQLGQISLAEMSEYRKISEAATVAWAAQRNTPQELEALAQTVHQMSLCIDDYEKFVDMDSQFHGLLAAAAKNQVSVAMNETLSKLNRSFVKDKMATLSPSGRKKMCQKVQSMHETILAAVQAHDEAGARKAMAQHLEAFGSDLR